MHTTRTDHILLSIPVALLATACVAADDPAPVECRVGSIVRGDVRSDSGDGLYRLAGVTKLKGNLYIDGADADELDQLGCLQSIEGDLVVVHTPALADAAPFAALTDVWGGITIASNANLTTLSGLESLQLVGTVAIINNPLLQDLSGLDALTVATGIEVSGNRSLADFSGLAGLERTGWLTITRNDVLPAVHLPNLRLVAEDVYIATNPGLESLSMPQLMTVGGELSVLWNPWLSQCDIDRITEQLADNGYVGDVFIAGNDEAQRCGTN